MGMQHPPMQMIMENSFRFLGHGKNPRPAPRRPRPSTSRIPPTAQAHTLYPYVSTLTRFFRTVALRATRSVVEPAALFAQTELFPLRRSRIVINKLAREVQGHQETTEHQPSNLIQCPFRSTVQGSNVVQQLRRTPPLTGTAQKSPRRKCPPRHLQSASSQFPHARPRTGHLYNHTAYEHAPVPSLSLCRPCDCVQKGQMQFNERIPREAQSLVCRTIHDTNETYAALYVDISFHSKHQEMTQHEHTPSPCWTEPPAPSSTPFLPFRFIGTTGGRTTACRIKTLSAGAELSTDIVSPPSPVTRPAECSIVPKYLVNTSFSSSVVLRTLPFQMNLISSSVRPSARDTDGGHLLPSPAGMCDGTPSSQTREKRERREKRQGTRGKERRKGRNERKWALVVRPEAFQKPPPPPTQTSIETAFFHLHAPSLFSPSRSTCDLGHVESGHV